MDIREGHYSRVNYYARDSWAMHFEKDTFRSLLLQCGRSHASIKSDMRSQGAVLLDKCNKVQSPVSESLHTIHLQCGTMLNSSN